MNSVYPENKRDPYVTSLSLSCAVGTSVIVFPSVFSASPCALLCSRITLSLPISEEPKVDAGPSVVLTAGSHSRRLAVRGDAETVGSWQPPPVCRAGDVLSRPLSVGKASRQVSSPMAIRNGHGKSCGGDGKKNLMRPLRKSFPIRKPWLTTNGMRLLRKFFPSGNHG